MIYRCLQSEQETDLKGHEAEERDEMAQSTSQLCIFLGGLEHG